MPNDYNATRRDAGVWAKNILARTRARPRRLGLALREQRTRTHIRLLVVCKLLLIITALIIE